jgi:hypothetical protein
LPARALGPQQPFTPPSAAPRGADATAAATPSFGGLTGVRLGSSPRALIDGDWIALGQAVRDGRLVGVSVDAAVLRLADGRTEHLLLFPAAAAASTPDASIVRRNLP